MEKEHYLGSAQMVGEQLHYVVSLEGEWVALLGWSAASYHLRPREAWIGWSEDQRRERLPLVANNARFLILQPGRWPNLPSAALAGCMARLSQDWQALYGHPIVVVESFVDGQLFRSTAYKANGWEALGKTAGFARVLEDFYVPHERPKQLWVKALEVEGRACLRAPSLPPALAESLAAVAPPSAGWPRRSWGSLCERLHRGLEDGRSAEGLRHKQATFLCIVLLALLCGTKGGYWKLEQFARGLNRGQRRSLGSSTQAGGIEGSLRQSSRRGFPGQARRTLAMAHSVR
jgi:Druantia protein DruA